MRNNDPLHQQADPPVPDYYIVQNANPNLVVLELSCDGEGKPHHFYEHAIIAWAIAKEYVFETVIKGWIAEKLAVSDYVAEPIAAVQLDDRDRMILDKDTGVVTAMCGDELWDNLEAALAQKVAEWTKERGGTSSTTD